MFLSSLFCTFTAKSVGETILKIGKHLAKLAAKILAIFFADMVYIYTNLSLQSIGLAQYNRVQIMELDSGNLVVA